MAPVIQTSIAPVSVEFGQIAYLTPTVTIQDASGPTTYAWSRLRRDISGDVLNRDSTKNTSIADGSIEENYNALPADNPFRVRRYVTFTYQLRVTNGGVASVAQVVVTYRQPQPTITSLSFMPVRDLYSGESIMFMASASVRNPTSGGVTTYSWTVTGGGTLASTTGDTVSYRAPAVTSATTVTISVAANHPGAAVRLFRREFSLLPPPPAREAIQLRFALRVHPQGDLAGFAWWNGAGNVTVDGVQYAEGEVTGLGSFENAWDGTAQTAEILVDGTDPLFRSWLQAGPGARTVSIHIFQRSGASWSDVASFVGIAARCTLSENGGWVLEIDAATQVVSTQVRLVWSDESQQELAPGDRFLENAKALAKGISLIWPG